MRYSVLPLKRRYAVSILNGPSNMSAIYSILGRFLARYSGYQDDGILDNEPYNPQEEAEIAKNLISTLNSKQLEAFNKIIAAIDNNKVSERFFYLDGPGGSGKTYLHTTLISYVRGREQIASPFATTGIAATLMKGGRTVHSGFKLPVPLLENSVSRIRQTSDEANIFKKTHLILIDEITMLPKYGLNCIDQLLREIMKDDRPFGGKVLVVSGDFRQTLPVVPRGQRSDIVEVCIKSSELWHRFSKLSLTTNMRVNGQNNFSEWLLKIGLGGTSINQYGATEIPADLVINKEMEGRDVSGFQKILLEIYGPDISQLTAKNISNRVILVSTNRDAIEINNLIINRLPGEQKTYYSVDNILSEDKNDILNYPPEFLHAQTPSGMPPHELILKRGTIVLLIRNLNPKKGLYNGTRLLITNLGNNFITGKILNDCNKGEIINLPRIDLAPSETTLPFTLKRRQFPVIPAFAMTINKSQGQTFEHVGIYLNEPVFSHGQLYVALSRCKSKENTKIFIRNTEKQGQHKDGHFFTTNVVYKEIFTIDKF